MKCGYVAIIGRPNVGKSTLLNAILGKKVSITSRKPQTTRQQILGIKTIADVQTIYIDTPGLHTQEKHAMNRYMNRIAEATIYDADVIIFMIDSLRWYPDDEMILKKLATIKSPIILLINKIDKLENKDALLPFIATVKNTLPFFKIIPASVKRAKDVALIENEIQTLLPDNPHFFPDDEITDKNAYFQAAELIREKIIRTTGQEIPYSTAVQIDSFKVKNKVLHISATIWVERAGQKAIIIGKAGELLKKIGTAARKEMEILFGQKVFLQLWVKVKERWTDSESILQAWGYGDAHK